MQVWDVRLDLQGLEKLPWWWTTLLSLAKRINSVMEMSAFSADGKTLPPRNIWLSDEELRAWKSEQDALRKLNEPQP